MKSAAANDAGGTDVPLGKTDTDVGGADVGVVRYDIDCMCACW